MSKLKKVTYCKSCGQSNPWSLDRKSSLMQRPKFCCSCGSNLLTGQKPVENLNTEAETHEEDEEIVSISSNIPPLELDMQACYFPKRDSQALGSLVKPAKDAGENEDT
tara:strand:- start:440 stop:763 length:324 start_codon:yes stop_codon:yes gene_type:complete